MDKKGERLLMELNSAIEAMPKWYEAFVGLVLDLRDLHNPDVNKLFEKYQVVIKE